MKVTLWPPSSRKQLIGQAHWRQPPFWLIQSQLVSHLIAWVRPPRLTLGEGIARGVSTCPGLRSYCRILQPPQGSAGFVTCLRLHSCQQHRQSWNLTHEAHGSCVATVETVGRSVESQDTDLEPFSFLQVTAKEGTSLTRNRAWETLETYRDAERLSTPLVTLNETAEA